MAPDDGPAMHAHYELGTELERLDHGAGALELERTKEIIARHVPDHPCRVADIGGGPGRYTVWLAEAGHQVSHRDVVPLHVDQTAAAASQLDHVDTAIADARDLDLADGSFDVILLLGPLYHLPDPADRLRALDEARRISRADGLVFVAAISRWAARLHAMLADRMYLELPDALEHVARSEWTGRLHPLCHGSFTGCTHRPDELAAEVVGAGLELIELVNIEGPAALLPDLDDRLADPVDRAVVLDTARAVEHVPELIGAGPHLMAVARRP